MMLFDDTNVEFGDAISFIVYIVFLLVHVSLLIRFITSKIDQVKEDTILISIIPLAITSILVVISIVAYAYFFFDTLRYVN